jgi:hypothetical protein
MHGLQNIKTYADCLYYFCGLRSVPKHNESKRNSDPMNGKKSQRINLENVCALETTVELDSFYDKNLCFLTIALCNKPTNSVSFETWYPEFSPTQEKRTHGTQHEELTSTEKKKRTGKHRWQVVVRLQSQYWYCGKSHFSNKIYLYVRC